MSTLDLNLDPNEEAAVSESTDGVFSHNTGHVAEGISHLIDLFRFGPRNEAAVTAVLEQVQELEDAIQDVYTAFDPNTAVGHALDLLGRLVGEPRAGREDDEFRAAIRVRVLVNYSDGKVEQLYDIVNGVFSTLGTPPTVAVHESFPRTITVETMGDPGAVTIETLHRILVAAKAGGVKLYTLMGLDGAATDGDYTGVWGPDDDWPVADRDDPGDTGLDPLRGWNDSTNWALQL